MNSSVVIKKGKKESALDYRQLYSLGLERVQNLAKRIWTDFNVHDPGVTILELLCFAITDLGYRASFPIKDLLATESDNAKNMQRQFFTARTILPNRPLTVLDYRKILIDIPGVRNAWLTQANVTYYANPLEGTLTAKDPALPWVKPVNIAGLYNVIIDFDNDLSAEQKNEVTSLVKESLLCNRNLCEDFEGEPEEVKTQPFVLCCELELDHNADPEKVHASVLFAVERYLAPAVKRYSLSEMLSRRNPDGTFYTPDQIFNGPALLNGFIDGDELTKADLRTEIRLSDVIREIMAIEGGGVRAVKEIVINPLVDCPEGAALLPENKWNVQVAPGKKGKLCAEKSRIVLYKKNIPIEADSAKVKELLAEMNIAEASDATGQDDLEIPLGTYRHPDLYYSFQNHFPALYGVSDAGISEVPDDKRDQRTALSRQLKAYLLFFDQIMANYLSQLGHVKELFSTDPGIERTYFYQAVDSFRDFNAIYRTPDVVEALEGTEDESRSMHAERRNRFLDHLISRFAERFNEFVQIMHSKFGTTLESMRAYKSEFLNNYPAISSERSLAYNYSLTDEGSIWNTKNISGLEKRIARLLGIADFTRRDLAGTDYGEEGMYVIENILLRPDPGSADDPFLLICPGADSTACPDLDPYSYRMHVILPAYGARFKNMEFRRFVEQVIREETPAHIAPKICWINKEDMAALQKPYRDWLYLKAGNQSLPRNKVLSDFINALYKVKNVYEAHKLHECRTLQDKFLLDQSSLGSIKHEP